MSEKNKYLDQLEKGLLPVPVAQDELKTLKQVLAGSKLFIESLKKQQHEDKKKHDGLESALTTFKRRGNGQRYIRKAIYTLEDVFNMLGQGKIIMPDGSSVNTGSDRLLMFKQKGCTCVACGLEGSYFALEKDYKTEAEIYHFNLYAIHEGKEVLMTKDHIQPRSRGGKNVMENYQPMCVDCNGAKGNNWNKGE